MDNTQNKEDKERKKGVKMEEEDTMEERTDNMKNESQGMLLSDALGLKGLRYVHDTDIRK